MKAHHGAIHVTSEVGQGSTFRIFLPAAAIRDASVKTRDAVDLRGDGTVLVVDDESMMRNFTRAALERFGYKVLTANNGREAIAALDVNGCINLVLLDLSMPVMGGEETLGVLQQKCPGLKVLLMSGYGESEALRLFAGKGISSFLQKPFTAQRLAEQVKSVLAARTVTER